MRHRLFSSFAQFYNNIIFKPNTAAQNPLFFLFDISAVYKKRFCRNRGMNNNIAGSTSLQNRTAPRQPLVFENPYAHTIGLSNSYSPGLKPDNRAVFLCNISFIFFKAKRSTPRGSDCRPPTRKAALFLCSRVRKPREPNHKKVVKPRLNLFSHTVLCSWRSSNSAIFSSSSLINKSRKTNVSKPHTKNIDRSARRSVSRPPAIAPEIKKKIMPR